MVHYSLPEPEKLGVSEELERFEKLKPRLLEVWDALSLTDDTPHTSVVVPSLTLDQAELTKLEGASFYEERLLFLLIRLRNPRAHVVYVTSQPVHPMILEYYFELMSGVPASHARKRLTMLCCHDNSPRSLTEKILMRPRLIQRIREGIPDPERAYLTVFNSTTHERRLAVLLGIPMNGLDPELSELGTKSGNRRIFREAGVDLPVGYEDLKSETEVANALFELKREKPDLRRAVVKLNESFSGEGNALFRYPDDPSRHDVGEALANLEFSVPTENYESYFDKYSRMGGIVEEFIEGREKLSPSAQLRTDPRGDAHMISTHDQVLGGPNGQVFLGCRFPADDSYRSMVQDSAMKIGAVLGRHGVVSRFAVDFLVSREQPEDDWKFYALEINLRMGGTTHPFLALQFLTGGKIGSDDGLFKSPSGMCKYYRATDNLKSQRYVGLIPEDLIEIVTDHRLHYNYTTETGVLFHLIGALSQYGKIGMTAIGNNRQEAEQIYSRTLEILDREAARGHAWGPAGGDDTA